MDCPEVVGMSVDMPSSTSALVDMSSLECSLCLSLLCEPLTLGCGHTFCRVCVVHALAKSQKKCPNCRAVCHLDAQTHAETVLIASLLKSLFPAQYRARLEETEKDKLEWQDVLPIFFYNDVLFPGNNLTLHFFEERYKTMMRRVVAGERKFLYLPNFENYRASVDDVGLVAKLTECEFLSDGRCIVEVRMAERALIKGHWVEEGTGGLAFCKVQTFRDDRVPESDQTTLEERMTEMRLLTDRLLELIPEGHRWQLLQQAGEKPTEPEAFSFWAASLYPRSKMASFRTTSTMQRLDLVLGMLRSVLERMEQRAAAAVSSSLAQRTLNSLRQFFVRGGEDGEAGAAPQAQAEASADDDTTSTGGDDDAHPAREGNLAPADDM